MDLFNEAIAVMQALNEANVDYALVGGLAVGVYTVPRATRDIDLVFRQADWGQVQQILKPLGYEALDADPMPLAEGKLNLYRLIKIIPIEEDVLVLDLLSDAYAPAKLALDGAENIKYKDKTFRLGALAGLIELKRARASEMDLIDLKQLEPLQNAGR
jgi:hypothetical protein